MAKDKTTSKNIKDENLPGSPDDNQQQDQDSAPLSLEDQILELHSKLKLAQESEKRVLADYQNLLRRTREEKVEWARLANLELVEAMLEPLRNLSLAAKSLNDQGLDMVITQFWQKLNDQGLEEISADQVLNQPFDVETMEAVERKGEGELVIEVLTPGYKLNDRVITHARVIVGSATK